MPKGHPLPSSARDFVLAHARNTTDAELAKKLAEHLNIEPPAAKTVRRLRHEAGALRWPRDCDRYVSSRGLAQIFSVTMETINVWGREKGLPRKPWWRRPDGSVYSFVYELEDVAQWLARFPGLFVPLPRIAHPILREQAERLRPQVRYYRLVDAARAVGFCRRHLSEFTEELRAFRAPGVLTSLSCGGIWVVLETKLRWWAARRGVAFWPLPFGEGIGE